MSCLGSGISAMVAFALATLAGWHIGDRVYASESPVTSVAATTVIMFAVLILMLPTVGNGKLAGDRESQREQLDALGDRRRRGCAEGILPEGFRLDRTGTNRDRSPAVYWPRLVPDAGGRQGAIEAHLGNGLDWDAGANTQACWLPHELSEFGWEAGSRWDEKHAAMASKLN